MNKELRGNKIGQEEKNMTSNDFYYTLASHTNVSGWDYNIVRKSNTNLNVNIHLEIISECRFYGKESNLQKAVHFQRTFQ